MVDPKEQTREAIQKLITYVSGLEQFDRKMEVMDALLNVEWSLHPKEQTKEVVIDIPEEFENGHEEGWNT